MVTGDVSMPCARSQMDLPCASNPALHRVDRERHEFAERVNAETCQRVLGCRAEPGKHAQRQRRQECRLLAGLHHDESARLAQVRRDLGHQLARGHAARRVQMALIQNAIPDLGRNRCGFTEAHDRCGDVKERFVE